MRKPALVILGLMVALSLLLAGRGGNSFAQPAKDDAAGDGGIKAGDAVTVYFRGDASGIAYHDRVVDLGNMINRRGTVDRLDAGWLVLKDGERRYHIPRASILAVESGGAKAPKDVKEAKEKAADAARVKEPARKPGVKLDVDVEN